MSECPGEGVEEVFEALEDMWLALVGVACDEALENAAILCLAGEVKSRGGMSEREVNADMVGEGVVLLEFEALIKVGVVGLDR
jgi:hypothetical protein